MTFDGRPVAGLKRFVARLINAGLKWADDGASLMAAAVAYSAALSFFPILLLMIAGLGYVLRVSDAGADARVHIHDAIAAQTSVVLAGQIDDALAAIGEQSATNGLVGWVTLMFTSLLLFVQFSAAFDRIWNVRVPDDQSWFQMGVALLKQRAVAFVLLTVVGLIVVLTSAVGLAVQAVSRVVALSETFWTGVSRSASFGLNILAFTLLFRLLPPKLVTWRGCLRGAVLGATLWEVGRWALATFLVAGRYSSAYDVIGSFIAVLLWVYYAAAVIFFAAEFVQAHDEEFPQLPPEPAVLGPPDVPHVDPVAGDAAEPEPSVLTEEGDVVPADEYDAGRADRPAMGPESG